jgi:hypothetical protein
MLMTVKKSGEQPEVAEELENRAEHHNTALTETATLSRRSATIANQLQVVMISLPRKGRNDIPGKSACHGKLSRKDFPRPLT